MALAEKAGIPFAPVNQPIDLVNDEHLNLSGSLAETKTPAGNFAKLPKIPLRLDGSTFDLRNHPPEIGEGSLELYRSIGYSDRQIKSLLEEKVIQIREEEWNSSI